jgi:hypothetical protein
MNSITKHITPASIVAALRQFRSARKDIILVVEGDDDIALFSQSLGLASNCFISCFGKENLMKVFGLVPNEHVDIGMFFIRDADFDGLKHQRSEGVCFFVSDRYDFEMSVVEGRIFHRIFAEFLKKKMTTTLAASAFTRVVDAVAWLGALRLYSQRGRLNLDFR